MFTARERSSAREHVRFSFSESRDTVTVSTSGIGVRLSTTRQAVDVGARPLTEIGGAVDDPDRSCL